MDRVTTPRWRRASTSPVVASYQVLDHIAQRIIKRTMNGRHDIAAELIMRELSSGEPQRAYGLALALTEEAIATAAEPRAAAVARGATWKPVLQDATTGGTVTPADQSDTAAGLVVRMLDAMHRHTAGAPTALTELGDVYKTALTSPPETFFGFYEGLVNYAVAGQLGELQTTT
jgi:hypothetical protein